MTATYHMTKQPDTERFTPVKKLLALIPLAFLVLTAAPAQADEKDDTDRHIAVTICHFDGQGRGRIIVIAKPALQAHLDNHGDYVIDLETTGRRAGQFCPKEEVPSTTTTTTEPTRTIPKEISTTTTTTTQPPTTISPEQPHVVCVTPGGFPFKQAPGPCPPPHSATPSVPTADVNPATNPDAAGPVLPLRELPRTGGGVGLLASVGGLLAATGVILRRLS